MKKGIVLLSIALLIASLAALPVAARGSREPSPTPTPAPAPAVPAYIDVPTWYTQTAPIPPAGSIMVRMRITVRTWTSGDRREVVGSPSFDVTHLAPWPYTLLPLQPPSIERYPNLIVWSQYYQGIRIAGVYGSPHDPFTGFPPVMYAYPRVLFTF
jgi:hypothetical protein